MKGTLPLVFPLNIEMQKSSQQIALFGVLLLINVIAGGCFLYNEEQGNWTTQWPPEIHSKVYPQSEDAKFYYTYHALHPGDGNNYYGLEATMDVYGFNLHPGQRSAATIWIINRGDGQPSSLNGIQVGWLIHPTLYKDSHTHFYTLWTSGGSPLNGCFDMRCPGFRKTTSSISPGDVIKQVTTNPGDKQYITLRVFKDKSSGDWHVHYGLNGATKSVGYFPKSMFPGLADKPVTIHFGGYVSHGKARPSPPMGSGYAPTTSRAAASLNGLKVIDADGNSHLIDKNLPYYVDPNGCYPITYIDGAGRFFYGGPGNCAG